MGRTVILCPPREMTPADDTFEDETGDTSRHVLRRHSGRDEDDRPVEVLKDDVVELQPHDPLDGRCEESREEEDHQAVVNLTLRELAGRTDDAPDHRGRAEDLRRGADEPVQLVSIAHPADIREHSLNSTKALLNDDGTALTSAHCLRVSLENHHLGLVVSCRSMALIDVSLQIS